MSILTKPLFALSKTDTKLIKLCSDNAYKTQAGYGLFILIIGIFAFFSSSYALKTTLDISGVYFIAAIYATLIMMIDREIVSAANKSRVMIITRLVLAICAAQHSLPTLQTRSSRRDKGEGMGANFDCITPLANASFGGSCSSRTPSLVPSPRHSSRKRSSVGVSATSSPV